MFNPKCRKKENLNMKKTFMILGAALMALVAVGCQNEPMDEGVNVGPEQNGEFALYASLPATRTTLNSDFSVAWHNTDQIAVFNAPAGTTDYSANLHFYIDEEATGKFTPEEGLEVSLEEGVNYDWYVIMPWRSTNGVAEMVTPKGQSKEDGYFPIGAATQTGYNNSTHVSSSDVMVGKAMNTRTPNVALKHLAVLHKFTVTNDSKQPTVINKLTIDGGENKLFGTFWVDLTADEPALDVAKANATFNERALTVKEGTELAVGESADFYIITAPFVLNAGETFKVTIDTTTGVQVVEKTAESDITFAAGTYNTATLVYNHVPVYADYLYYETFNTSMTISGTSAFDVSQHEGSLSSGVKGEFKPSKLIAYNDNKEGTSVYDGVISAITYTCDGNGKESPDNASTGGQACLSKNAASSITNVTGAYVWFRKSKGGWVRVDGIRLHDTTELNLSYVQNIGAGGSVKAEYSVDGGENWVELGSTNANGTHSFDFSVNLGSKTISLRFTENGTNNVRIDDIKLTWQEI